MNPASLENLKLGRIKSKERHSITISPENWQWLQSIGKPSQKIDLIVGMCRRGELVGRELLKASEAECERLRKS
ncbi:MAG: hypothetical protein AAF349_21880 [Cyanobacteria bacterium P01_A01_bin.68]